MLKLTRWLHTHWRALLTDSALLATLVLIGVLDVMAGSRIRLTAFFLIPIMLLTWRRGRLAGYAATLVALLFLLAVDIQWNAHAAVDTVFVLDMLGRFIAFFVNVAVLAQLRKLYLQQKQIATRDPLTHLHNRLGWREIVGVSLEKARRESRAFGVLFLDCDNFKAVNDRFGHGVGDQLLKAVAHCLQSAVRSSDVTCRLGGDEFVAFFDHLGAPELARLGATVKEGLDKVMRARSWPVTFSIGSVLFEEVPTSVDEVLGIADALMYAAKRSGKDCLHNASWRHTGMVLR